MSINLERMLKGYVECAEWADCGPDQETYECDWSTELLDTMRADCETFVAACGEPLLDALAELAPEYSDERFGHDFWLTRNGHGAGYWDRQELDALIEVNGVTSDLTLAKALTDLAQAAGACELYVGDDGMVYA